MAAVLALVLAAAPARAAAPDSLAARTPPGIQVVRDAPYTAPVTARADTLRRRPWHEQPRFVMARSLLIPGWGQVHNHAWIKAGLVAGAEGWIAARIVQDQHGLDDLSGEIDRARAAGDAAGEAALVNEYNDRLDQRLGREWILGGVIAYALIDAYVDANFRGFDVEFRHDPALPAGTSPPSSPGGGNPTKLRLALRWHF